MCGIVGYIGEQQAAPILLDGLEKLEYRGYDSAGISVYDGTKLDIRKKKGRLAVLKQDLEQNMPTGTVGIGHTRWATHGAPSDQNSHPHINQAGTISVVHNGIIENHAKIREWLSAKGYSFRSQTDTEVIAHLIDYYYRGNIMEAVSEAVKRLVGSYAICILCGEDGDRIIAVRKGCPIVLGAGEGENYIASDIPALLKYTRDVYFLEDNEIACVTKDSIDIYDAFGVPVMRELFHVDWELEAAEKAGYPHFMIKEIHEEPKALRDALYARLTEEGKIDLSEVGIDEKIAKKIERIIIVACGTAYHAGVVAKYIFEKLVRIPVEIDIASEYRYRDPIVKDGDLFISISQSGETADTLEGLRLAKKQGAEILGIVNAVGSTISREADAVMYTLAGPEIAVASTKAYATQVMCLTLLAVSIAKMRGTLEDARYREIIQELRKIPELAEKVFEKEERIKRIAHSYSTAQDMYFLGRNLDYAVAMEGSLKLKEISYIHSEAFGAGELKHGPIALIEEGTYVVVFATQPELYEKIASNIKEVKARGAHVLSICSRDADLVMDISDDVIRLPETDPMLAPMISVIPSQLFSYYCAIERGLDVDKPRNLAKSVTVE